MEGGALFNPGFLGGSFLWWVGQIADDSTWRDNILPGKFENKNSIPAWGGTSGIEWAINKLEKLDEKK